MVLDLLSSDPTIISHIYRNKREINAAEEKYYVQILINNENITFKLDNRKDLLLLEPNDNENECIFQGESIKPNNSFIIALTGCGYNLVGFNKLFSGL